MDIEVFKAENPPRMQQYGEALETGILRGNMGSLVVIKLGSGLELAEHAHEQEHVGAVLAGEFSFTDGDKETALSAGDLYRVPPNVTHGVRCTNYALVVQARRFPDRNAFHVTPLGYSTKSTPGPLQVLAGGIAVGAARRGVERYCQMLCISPDHAASFSSLLASNSPFTNLAPALTSGTSR